MTKRTRVLNDIGCGMKGLDAERMGDIRVYVQGSAVMVEVEVDGREALQYMTPTQAMAFAKAFERCAIEALRVTGDI